MNFVEEMRWRGLLHQATPGIEEILQQSGIPGYIGFDPTAASLHVGSLLPVLALARLQRSGHRPIAVVGGGTGLIGDPSGKSSERPMLTTDRVEENLRGIESQLRRFLDFDAGASGAVLVNNAEWLLPVNLVSFLRDIGKHFSINQMLTKESVKRRIEQQEGMSYTEFSYMLLQAYDYLVLFDRFGCRLQMGGSDQLGNILAGIDLIRRLRGTGAAALVTPLITNASGTKFGKTESGTVWLDERLTSPFRYYQFWLNADDRDVIAYLKYFTWLSQAEIDEITRDFERSPENRVAQRTLAEKVTEMTHGRDALRRAQATTEVLFGGGPVFDLRADELLDAFGEAPSSEAAFEEMESGKSLSELLAATGLTKSKGDARRLIQAGGAYLNNERVGADRTVTLRDAIDSTVLLLRKGKKDYHIVRIGEPGDGADGLPQASG